MKAGKSLVELAQELQSRAARKSDYVADTRAVTMDEKGAGLVIASADPIALSVDTHTHRQIGTHLGIPSKYYDRATELEAMGGQILDLAANDWTVIAQAA